MSDFDSSVAVIDGEGVNLATLFSNVDSLAARHDYFFSGTDYTTSSGTYADLASVDVAMDVDEIALVTGVVNWSGTVEGDELGLLLSADGVTIPGTGMSEFSKSSAGGGRTDVTQLIGYHRPSIAGTITFALEWAMTGSGQFVTEAEGIFVTILKKGS